ncbi:MAG: CTP synthase [Treponema sp.]|nr:CTP synthase [Treponema sp.]
MNKFIFVSGGVCSSLGKGVAASSMAALLESRGLNVRMVKCDPYINVNAGTMSPYTHGEVYVTDDGAETDLDLGNYARFTSVPLSRANSITTGQVYESVIRKEREGRYLGRCVQVIPHITDEIKARIQAVIDGAPDNDIVIVEIGGTVGDIECIPFLEAARQLIMESGRTNAISVHLTLIPIVAEGELKTKPTQHSVKAMQEMGIQPDVLICRAPVLLDEATRRKIALFTNIDNDAVFTCRDIDDTIYEIPQMFYEQKLDQVVLKKLGIEARHAELAQWHSVMERFKSRKGTVKIGVVGKYMDLHDAYKSVYEAFFHAGLECGVEVELVKIDSSRLEEEQPDQVMAAAAASSAASSAASAADGNEGINGILVPGGFGPRGIAGMVNAAAWARKNKIPFLGISLGMHVMTIDWARNVLGWETADSTEFNPDTKYPVVSLIAEQTDVKNYSGTIRLGKGVSVAEPDTLLLKAYGEKTITERHRHRFEFSNMYRKEMKDSGLVLSGFSADGSLVDCIEWPRSGEFGHPWGVGAMFHPEFKSRPTAAAPLFRDFIAAAKSNKGL